MSFGEFYQGFAGLGNAFSKGYDEADKKATLTQLGSQLQSGDYSGAAQTAFKSGDPDTGMKLLNLGQGAQNQALVKSYLGGGADSPLAPLGGAAAAPQASAPAFAGGKTAMSMPTDPDAEGKFVGTLKAGGLTNPFGLAAFAAYANAESRYSPKNINGSWSDPSQSGAPGTSGGILSWRGDRLSNMRAATAGASDPVVAQAKFALTENPQLTVALQNAKSPEEANSLLANAWKFAGYNQPGGEYARRLALTQNYVGRLGSLAGGGTQDATSSGQPTVAQASSSSESASGSGVDPGALFRITNGAKASPDVPVTSFVPPAVAEANPSLYLGQDGKPLTVGQVAAKLSGVVAPQQVATATPPLPPARPFGIGDAPANGAVQVASADPNFAPQTAPSPQQAAAAGMSPSAYLTARAGAAPDQAPELQPKLVPGVAASGLVPISQQVPQIVAREQAAGSPSSLPTGTAQRMVASGLVPPPQGTPPAAVSPPQGPPAPSTYSPRPQPGIQELSGDFPVLMPDGKYWTVKQAAATEDDASPNDTDVQAAQAAVRARTDAPAPTGSSKPAPQADPAAVSAAAPQIVAQAGLPPAASASLAANTDPMKRVRALTAMMMLPGLNEGTTKVLSTLLSNELDQTKMPESVKQYMFAKSQDPSVGTYTQWTDRNQEKKLDAGEKIDAETAARMRSAQKLGLTPGTDSYRKLVAEGKYEADPSSNAPMFDGKSVEGQGLNYLVQSGQLTRDQAAQMAAGKTVTNPADGSIMFLTPQGIFGRPANGGPARPITPPAAGSETNAPRSGLTSPAPVLSQPEAPAQTAAQPGDQSRPGMIQLTGPKGDKTPNENQSNAASYAARMEKADQILAQPGVSKALMGRFDRSLEALNDKIGVGHGFTSDSYQSGEQAQREFLNAILRRESGAAIGKEEFTNYAKQFFPEPGDSEARLQQKADSRRLAIEGLKTAAGPAYKGTASAPQGGGKPSAADRFNQLITGGASKAQAYEALSKEGY